jgi:hypothetical protein
MINNVVNVFTSSDPMIIDLDYMDIEYTRDNIMSDI